MLGRASSDAGTRIRRSKSTSTIHRPQPSISKPLDWDFAQQQALAAATTAFVRAQGHDAADRKAKRSSELSRSKSNASRKSLTSQGSHFPPRESSFRPMPPPKVEVPESTHRQSRASTFNTEKFPPFYPTPSNDRPLSDIRTISAQPSITFNESWRPSSQPKPHRASVSSTVTSQQIRKARSMYYASSIQTGSPIARPPAKYLTPPPLASSGPTPDPMRARPQCRTPAPSPLVEPRIPVTVAADETVDKARDRYLQSFQQKTVKHKPSIFLAPFMKRQDKEKDDEIRVVSSVVSKSVTTQQTPVESTAESVLNDFLPQPESKEKRSFSGSLKNKFKKVFRRASTKSQNLPVQQIEASRDYVDPRLSPPKGDDVYAIPSPDEEVLQRVRSRTPSLEGGRPVFVRSTSRTSSNGSSRSNRSLHSEANATHASTSRVTSWGTSSTSDTLTQRAIKRLTVIHEAKDSIGSEADRLTFMVPHRKSLPLTSLASFCDPMPMESLTEETLTSVDPKRVFSALMREIDASKPAQASSGYSDRTPGADSDVFESGTTRELHASVWELQSHASRGVRPDVSSDQRPPSRRPGSAAAQSSHSKTSTIRSLGRAIRSTIRTVTPAEHHSSSHPKRISSERGTVCSSRDDVDTPTSSTLHGSGASGDKEQPYGALDTQLSNDDLATKDCLAQMFTPSASQIERRVERAQDRWKTPLEDSEHLHFPRETDRNYDVTTVTGHVSALQTCDDGPLHNAIIKHEPYGNYVHGSPLLQHPPTSPAPRNLMSPLSPSIYSRNTDGISLLPNDSVMSFDGPETVDHSHDGGCAVILTSQSVRSYVIGTPSPRRPVSTRTSRDWKAWLSHEVSGMELDSHEDLTIHERYTTPTGKYRRDPNRTSHTEQDGSTTVILRESCEVITPRADFDQPALTEPSRTATHLQDQNDNKVRESTLIVTTPVFERSNAHPDVDKEVSLGHTQSTVAGVSPKDETSGSDDNSIVNRPRVSSIPSQHSLSSQPAFETPNSSRMNERFPFINTGRRSSSNSARSSRQSKSPVDSLASLKSLQSAKATPGPKVYSDLSLPATALSSQRQPNTALKRRDAQYKRKENVTPPSLHGNSRADVAIPGITCRTRSLQPLSSNPLNENITTDCNYTSNDAVIKHVEHWSSPAATPSRPCVRATLRSISPEKLVRCSKSAFDLRGTNLSIPSSGLRGVNVQSPETTITRPISSQRRPALHLKSSDASMPYMKESGPDTKVTMDGCAWDDDRDGSITPGHRMADQFLKVRQSTPALDSTKHRGGMRLVREDTPAFL